MKHFSLWLALAAVPLYVTAQDVSSPIPFDANVKTGKLQNGLTYYIRKNSLPQNKVDLRLVVNAGSVLEDDDQQGLAHFMEHMNFNGTKRFPKNKLVDYLQSIGVKFGQHLNAYTSFDETVYFLPIPSDNPEKLEKGFQIIEDWAFNAVLTPEEVDKERGVVLEEYRLGLGASDRMEKRYMPKMLYKSHYSDRMPIGKKDILENFKYDVLTRFYKDWYRPDLMAVIVVGDIDVAAMEKKIQDHFGSYKNPKNERPRATFDLPNHTETFVAIETDKEAAMADVQLMYKDAGLPHPNVTYGDFKRYLNEGLFTTMLNNRLQELTHTPTPPFTYGYSYHGQSWVRSKEAYQSFALTPADKQLDALKVLVEENLRVKKYGFTQGELDRAKTEYLAQIESRYNDRDKTESENYVWGYQQHFLTKEASPGVEWEFDKMKKELPNVKLADVNGFINTYIRDDSRVVILTGPEKEGLKKPTEAAVLAILNSAGDNLNPYTDTAAVSALLHTEDIKPGSVVKKETNAKLGTTTLTLSNGAKVTYKKTDFKNDEILMEAVSHGGTNLYTNDDYKKTQWANGAVYEAGFGGLKINDINKFMTGKLVNVNPFVRSISEGLSGSSTPKDLEYMFQMVYGYFTDLNNDNDAYIAYKQKQSSFYDNMMGDPNYYFMQEFYSYLNREDPRFNGIVPSKESWEKTDYQLALKKYKERFDNAADFDFYFVGNIDDKKMEEYAAKYIASLPASDKREVVKDTGYRMPKGDLKKIVNKGTEPKSTVRIMYYGETAYSEKEAAALNALGEILTIKFIEELRENESGVYGIGAHGSLTKVPYGSYTFNVSFPCGPENAEKLTASALREIQKVIDKGPEAKDVAKFKEAELLEYKKNIRENNFWIERFTEAYDNGTNPESILAVEQKINAVTPADIQAVAKKYLTKDKVIGILMPEEKK